MLIRTLAYMLGAILMISLLRTVIGGILRLLTGGAMRNQAGQPGTRPGSGSRSSRASEPLKKDPVCGTFVVPSASVQATKGGQTYYFCSASCRDKFAA